MLVDSHCHLDRLKLDEFENGLDTVLANAEQQGVEHFLCVCVSLQDFNKMRDAVAGYNNVSISCGVHPLHQEDAAYTYDDLIALAADPSVVAIGETGLDFYYSPDSKAIQTESFRKHVRAAVELNKPLIIHTRDARQLTIDILREEGAEKVGGVLHCFTESLEMAQQAMELGFYISISGIVTFKNAKELQDTVRQIPLERLLVETDSPWLAPIPYRGKQNQPAYVKNVAQFVADLKGVSLEELAQVTTQNYYDLFALSKKV
ncbi:metal-dependent hydrolase [Saccharobesus litoralis]|uniref:Metal-dependent hydrolase n=1 Tax=Saccharobesus litoralis TaxID=2172099 RepID=A0A2S0VP42_9ALTE|nr:YchF/TatD family DNA exonuclease [Saccharobesus litoralis]AWB65974.1 metal-dependent hydrolase [Saccharobesus litoralis]